MVLSEVFRDTDRTSARGADSTEASSEASEEAAPRVTSPVTATPAAVSWSEKAFAASIAGSLGYAPLWEWAVTSSMIGWIGATQA